MASIGTSIDQYNAILAEEAVGAAIVDIGRDKEMGFRTLAQICINVESKVQFYQSAAGVGIDRPHDQREFPLANKVPQCRAVVGNI